MKYVFLSQSAVNDDTRCPPPWIFRTLSNNQSPVKKSHGGTVFGVDLNNYNLKRLIDVQLETLAGDLILIDMNTVHTSGFNKTKYKVKYSAQARFHAIKKYSNLMN